MLRVRTGERRSHLRGGHMSNRLYRDPQRGALGGVCSGLADYLGVEVWVVRLVAVTALIFASFLTILLYLAAWAILDKKPASAPDRGYGRSPLKQHGWQQGLMPGQALTRVSDQLAELEQRLQAMERCVTSREYQMRHDWKRME